MRFVFRPADGTPLDDYTDPQGRFVQECTVIEHPDLPSFRAYYRPDTTGGREEWVFKYGDPWQPPPTAHLVAYTATITCANGDTLDIDVPPHYWFARWRWQSAPRPVRTSHAQLVAQDLIPCIDTAGLVTGGLATVSAYAPMSYCGIPADQGQTGGYPGLGIMTGWQAQYLSTRRARIVLPQPGRSLRLVPGALPRHRQPQPD